MELQRGEKLALTEEQKRAELKRLVEDFTQADDRAKGDETPEVIGAREGLRRAVALARELGESSLPDLEHALKLQQQLADAFPNDPVLVSQLDELGVQVSEMRLEIAEAESRKIPTSSGGREGAASEVARLREEKQRLRIAVAERAAHSNPTSAEAQRNLGMALVDVGRHREAVKPLQRAKKDPRDGIDIEAMALLADCFVVGGLHHLAVKEIEEALTKLDGRGGDEADLQWKELKYRQALVYDQTDEKAKAKEIFAEIYAKDSEFRDVDERVWGGG